MLSSYVNTPFASAHNNEKLIKSFQSTPNGVFADKCHLFLSLQKLATDNDNIASSNSEELLGVVIDSEVKFSRHIENLCRCRIFGVEFGVESISTLSTNI